MPLDGTNLDLRREFIRYLREEGPKVRQLRGGICDGKGGYCAIGLFGKMQGLNDYELDAWIYHDFAFAFDMDASEVIRRNDTLNYTFSGIAQWLESRL